MDHGHRIYKNTYPKANSQIYFAIKMQTKYFKNEVTRDKITGRLEVEIN